MPTGEFGAGGDGDFSALMMTNPRSCGFSAEKKRSRLPLSQLPSYERRETRGEKTSAQSSGRDRGSGTLICPETGAHGRNYDGPSQLKGIGRVFASCATYTTHTAG